MNNLEQLKKRLLGREKHGKNNQIFNLCAVMEIVGGYAQLQELPLPTVDWIVKYLIERNKATK